MTIIDSNIWIALFNPEDSQHEKAERFMEKIKGDITLPELLIIEICTVLTQRWGKEAANQFLDYATSTRNIHLTFIKDIFPFVLEFYQSSPVKGLSFIDIYLLYLSKQATVHTFDKQLQKAIQKS